MWPPQQTDRVSTVKLQLLICRRRVTHSSLQITADWTLLTIHDGPLFLLFPLPSAPPLLQLTGTLIDRHNLSSLGRHGRHTTLLPFFLQTNFSVSGDLITIETSLSLSLSSCRKVDRLCAVASAFSYPPPPPPLFSIQRPRKLTGLFLFFLLTINCEFSSFYYDDLSLV